MQQQQPHDKKNQGTYVRKISIGYEWVPHQLVRTVFSMTFASGRSSATGIIGTMQLQRMEICKPQDFYITNMKNVYLLYIIPMQHLQRNWSTCLIIYKDKCRYGFCVAKQKTWFIQPLHTSSVSMLDLKELKGCTLGKKKNSIWNNK